MRRLLRLFRVSPPPARAVPIRAVPIRRPNASAGYYWSAARPPISGAQVRHRQFNLARRGLDPAEVRAFLNQVANELVALRAELARTHDENVRIKNALRDWQSQVGSRMMA
ncbi:DivIVA domain-containing protein [Micromonospora sp. HM5-17]|jgi:DivIVA domain-containing protein|uniref:DivIVA domain-containing protein n=1 Tax=Micromonospora sp. HM5-17 TaxID=2487710 RepID=UPI000F4A461B|nr:DivIVA domain-containing protein [Micromonospora sp. HM5-17]ROT31898.1 DivIVA domain-containing protein [Micromonospora sp. HM5-17]